MDTGFTGKETEKLPLSRMHIYMMLFKRTDTKKLQRTRMHISMMLLRGRRHLQIATTHGTGTALA